MVFPEIRYDLLSPYLRQLSQMLKDVVFRDHHLVGLLFVRHGGWVIGILGCGVLRAVNRCMVSEFPADDTRLEHGLDDQQ